MIGRNWATCFFSIASCSAGEEPTGSAAISAKSFSTPGGGGPARLGCDIGKALQPLGVAHSRRSLAREPIDDLLRRLRRREQPVPALGFAPGKAQFAHGGQIGQGGDTLRRVGGQCFQRALADIAEGGRKLVAAELQPPGEKFLLQRRCAL